jgi:hypothetical protein
MKLSELDFPQDVKELIKYICIESNAQQLVIADGEFKTEWWKKNVIKYVDNVNAL